MTTFLFFDERTSMRDGFKESVLDTETGKVYGLVSVDPANNKGYYAKAVFISQEAIKPIFIQAVNEDRPMLVKGCCCIVNAHINDEMYWSI